MAGFSFQFCAPKLNSAAGIVPRELQLGKSSSHWAGKTWPTLLSFYSLFSPVPISLAACVNFSLKLTCGSRRVQNGFSRRAGNLNPGRDMELDHEARQW